MGDSLKIIETTQHAMSSNDIFWSLLDLYFDNKQYEEDEWNAKYPLLTHLNLYHNIKWGNYKGLFLAINAHANPEQKKHVQALEIIVQGWCGDSDSETFDCYQFLHLTRHLYY